MNDKYENIEELEYFNELLDNLSSGTEFPLEGLDHVMSDHLVMIKLVISTRLATEPAQVIRKLEQLKLQCCEMLLRGYKVNQALSAPGPSGTGIPSPATMRKIVMVCLLNSHLEDLLLFYRKVLQNEDLLSYDFNRFLN
ncbi:MAG: hypothetical protein V4594_03075 [Bacteroidota bacterium]